MPNELTLTLPLPNLNPDATFERLTRVWHRSILDSQIEARIKYVRVLGIFKVSPSLRTVQHVHILDNYCTNLKKI
jgi:hypothetical protein